MFQLFKVVETSDHEIIFFFKVRSRQKQYIDVNIKLCESCNL